MAVDGGSPALAIRSSVGIELWSSAGPKLPYEHKLNLPREETRNCRSISFSPDGRYFAYSNGQEVKVLNTSNWEQKCTLPRPKAFYLKFSTRGNFLCTWELYVVNKERPEGSPNMFVYEIENGNEVFACVQKNQTDWEPSWSSDETLFAMIVGGEALFYDLSEGLDGFKKTSRKIGGSRGGALSIGPGNCPPYLAFYTPGAKGAASMCRLYKYPALGQNQSIAYKGFLQADKVEILWNNRGTGLLLLTSTEVDKSGASYYGNQGLHFMTPKGDSYNVPLSKKGPVHCVKWSPKAKEFVVVYGYVPSKASLYNLKCDVIFDFDEGPRNCAYFNPFGNILVLAGFGNLPGNVEIWDISKKEKLANIKCPDTTFFEWNPNGEYFMTATTAPRLRIGNGFKVYHYSGALMHETIWPAGQELLGVEWQKFPDKAFTEPVITKAKQEGIKSSQPEASKKAYTPPHLRLMKEGKNPEKYLPQPKASTSAVPSGQANQSTNNKKVNSDHSNKAYRNKQNKKKGSQVVSAAPDNGGGSATVSDDINSGALNNSDGNTVASQSNGTVPPIDFSNYQQLSQQQQLHQPQRVNQRKQHHSLHAQQQNMQQNQLLQQPQIHPQQQPPINKTTSNQSLKMNSNQIQYDLNSVSSGQDLLSSIQLQQKSSKRSQQSDKEKKIRNIAKKLSDIKKLKLRQEQGETLELNQLQKISMEEKFLNEFKALKLTE